MGSLISALENMINIKEMADVFEKLGFKVNRRTIGVDVSGKFSIKEKIAVIKQWCQLTNYRSDFQIFCIIFTEGNLLRRHMRMIMNSFSRMDIRPLVCFTDQRSVILSTIKDIRIEKGEPVQEVIILPIDQTYLNEIQRCILTDLRPKPGDSPKEIANKIADTIYLTFKVKNSFNNIAVFSEHFLTNRLQDEKEWDTDVTSIIGQLKALISKYRDTLNFMDERATYENVVMPILHTLGYSHSGSIRVDDAYRIAIYNPADINDNLALCHVKYYERPLDRVLINDPRDRMKNVHPGFEIVGKLQETENTEWGILTNGKLWRLYTKKTNCTATNYYEVDLDILLKLDNHEAFKYFYLFFRAESFIQDSSGLSFLDRVLEGSQRYAKELEKDLKKRVFETVFPVMAKGFKHHRLIHEDIKPEEETPETLKDIFHGTMRVLYRLLFLLYAESRGLLPAEPGEPYYLRSLLKECLDIKEDFNRGEEADEISQDRWNNLANLFNIINNGSKKFNVPKYNGGLFDPKSKENRFLKEHKMGDKWVEEALRLLTLTEDGKGDSIDYRDLGVRQLGSIYEGLLEFHLEIADEKLVVVKEKGKEKFKPLTEIKKIPRNPKYIEKGEIYLVNDKKERKATGSYYTPDYIVKYIVENTVGKLMDEREKQFEKFMGTLSPPPPTPGPPRFKGKDREAAVDLLLSLKVLDPAMGSGHFLVETVDYITDRIVGIMNKNTQNPFMEEIETIREEIISELEKDKVEIEVENDLKDTNIIKRMVMKRCIYGVDLNEMAVELAKLSLRLDSFTKGAPLSFMDHHLKCGNSLIGANLKDIGKYPDLKEMKKERKKKAKVKEKEEGQKGMTDFGAEITVPKPYIDRLLTGMTTMADLHDESMEGIKKKKKTFDELKNSPEYTLVKTAADLYTSVFFGNKVTKKDYGDLNWSFLKAKNKGVEIERRMKKEEVKQAQQVTKENQFFHWELEFPEVFFEGGKVKENPGFDAVIGNPPYVVFVKKIKGRKSDFSIFQELPSNELDYYNLIFHNTAEYAPNTFALMTEKAMHILRTNGYHGFINPSNVLYYYYFKKLRNYILTNSQISFIVQIDRVFDEAETGGNAIIIMTKGRQFDSQINVAHIENFNEFHRLKYNIIDQKEYLADELMQWLTNPQQVNLLRISRAHCQPLSSFGIFYQGVCTGNNKKWLTNDSEHNLSKKVLLGRNINKYSVNWDELFLIFNKEKMWSNTDEELLQSKPKILIRQTGSSLIAAEDIRGLFIIDSLYLYKPNDDGIIRYILALLNSKLLTEFYRIKAPEKGRTFAQVKIVDLKNLPIRKINFTTSPELCTSLVEKVKQLYEKELAEILEQEAAT